MRARASLEVEASTSSRRIPAAWPGSRAPRRPRPPCAACAPAQASCAVRREEVARRGPAPRARVRRAAGRRPRAPRPRAPRACRRAAGGTRRGPAAASAQSRSRSASWAAARRACRSAPSSAEARTVTRRTRDEGTEPQQRRCSFVMTLQAGSGSVRSGTVPPGEGADPGRTPTGRTAPRLGHRRRGVVPSRGAAPPAPPPAPWSTCSSAGAPPPAGPGRPPPLARRGRYLVLGHRAPPGAGPCFAEANHPPAWWIVTRAVDRRLRRQRKRRCARRPPSWAIAHDLAGLAARHDACSIPLGVRAAAASTARPTTAAARATALWFAGFVALLDLLHRVRPGRAHVRRAHRRGPGPRLLYLRWLDRGRPRLARSATPAGGAGAATRSTSRSGSSPRHACTRSGLLAGTGDARTSAFDAAPLPRWRSWPRALLFVPWFVYMVTHYAGISHGRSRTSPFSRLAYVLWRVGAGPGLVVVDRPRLEQGLGAVMAEEWPTAVVTGTAVVQRPSRAGSSGCAACPGRARRFVACEPDRAGGAAARGLPLLPARPRALPGVPRAVAVAARYGWGPRGAGVDARPPRRRSAAALGRGPRGLPRGGRRPDGDGPVAATRNPAGPAAASNRIPTIR